MGDMVKLYFEEIEPVDADGDSALHVVDGPGAASPAREEGGAGAAGAAQSVRLASGGELADLRFDAFGEFASLNSTIRVPMECSALAPAGAGPAARGGAAMVCLGSRVLLFGGAARSGEHFNDMWRCTLPGAGRVRWERCDAPGAPCARSGHSLTLVPTSLSGPQQDQHGQDHPHEWGAVSVLFGGLNALEERAFNDVHVLSWSPEQAPRWLAFDCAGCAPQPRTAHSCSAVGSDLVVFGGSSPTCGALRDLHVLHVGLGRSGGGSGRPTLNWSTLRCSGPSPTMRELHGACVLGELTAPTELAFAHYGQGELEAGRAAATAPQVTPGAQADPTAALRHKEAGNAHFVRSEWDAARQCYDCALAADARGHVLYGNRSACLLKLGRAEEALADALSALRLSPRWGKGYLREALACAALGQRDAARTAYCAALECASSDSEREGFEKQRAAFESAIVEQRQQQLQQQRPAQESEALDGASPPEPPNLLNGQGPWLVVFGGRSNESVLCDMRVLDLRSHTWLPETIETPFPRCGHSCSRLDGSRLLMFGGWDGGGNIFNTAAVYDLSSRMWTECEIKGDLEPRFSHAECAQAPAEAPPRVLVFGGVSVEKDFADVIVLSQAPA